MLRRRIREGGPLVNLLDWYFRGHPHTTMINESRDLFVPITAYHRHTAGTNTWGTTTTVAFLFGPIAPLSDDA